MSEFKTLKDLEFPTELQKFRVFNAEGDFVEIKLSKPIMFNNVMHYITFSCELKDCFEQFLGPNITVEVEDA